MAEEAAQEAVQKQAVLQRDTSYSSCSRRSAPRTINLENLQVKEYDLDKDQSVGSTFFTNYSARFLYNQLSRQLEAKGLQL